MNRGSVNTQNRLAAMASATRSATAAGAIPSSTALRVRRIVGVPDVIIPARREHLAAFVKDEPSALVFPGQMGGPLRRGNFNKMSGWPHAVRAIGMEGLHFHDLRHAGNHLAAASGAGLKDLMARMGHDSERAALTPPEHEARGADKRITDAIDFHVQAERTKGDDGVGGALG